MTAVDRSETNRVSCECGKGEFVFYTCQNDGWSFINAPNEEWYEMHIFCESCVFLFQKYNPVKIGRTGEEDRWKIKVNIPDHVPEH